MKIIFGNSLEDYIRIILVSEKKISVTYLVSFKDYLSIHVESFLLRNILI